MSSAAQINHRVTDVLGSLGFESHPFLVDWYNQQVSDKFALSYAPGTLACIIISQPAMFERAFLPFLREKWDKTNIQDPIDQTKITTVGSELEIVSLHDFELTPLRRPKILVQTAGHVSGAVRFYRPNQFPKFTNNNYFPVCHHPRWGGWFALRGVLIFPEISEPDLIQVEPESPLSDSEAQNMMELYNTHWQDWRWRDAGCPKEKYSSLQIKYFETAPGERGKVIDCILQDNLDIYKENSS
ncbi:methylmalonic aciduria and homocystinuria type C protein homolog isoform X2 [Eurytemora carolleeae]|uniref:methylmalonic aciduria and homocystinuria type C protein homolog isoform X2 n=1 Tax=Eurytemora carolleeae TaxID=1294199 RepID=UPI000C76778D|nr:methylmalonic aciduria and homocystinuria type C protein homolog isoform X2 [Eurytemora carolleeae]|eukprot:XP_023335171.1 methylmalonic aciduria and homocystinuria type C protein homolog isoform X2 [Eurytemora affinis]